MNISPFLDDDQLIRTNAYQGQIYLFEENETSIFLVDRINQELIKTFGENPRKAQFNDEFLYKIIELKKLFYNTVEYSELAKKLMEEFGFDTEENVIDPIRLQVIEQNNLNAKSITNYNAHRDTWYANPQTQLTWWISLHDITIDEVFEIYPQYFQKAVKNDSKNFDYEKAKDKQNGNEEIHPCLLEKIEGEKEQIICKKGQILIFSSQHLHKIPLNSNEQNCFSFEFRSVHKEDYEKEMMPKNVDNYSKGISFNDYV